jgi:hypothetical protein
MRSGSWVLSCFSWFHRNGISSPQPGKAVATGSWWASTATAATTCRETYKFHWISTCSESSIYEYTCAWYVFIYIYMYIIWYNMYLCIYMYVCMYRCICVYMYMYMYVYICVCACVCIYAYCTYIHTCTYSIFTFQNFTCALVPGFCSGDHNWMWMTGLPTKSGKSTCWGRSCHLSAGCAGHQGLRIYWAWATPKSWKVYGPGGRRSGLVKICTALMHYIYSCW